MCSKRKETKTKDSRRNDGNEGLDRISKVGSSRKENTDLACV